MAVTVAVDLKVSTTVVLVEVLFMLVLCSPGMEGEQELRASRATGRRARAADFIGLVFMLLLVVGGGGKDSGR